VIHTRKAHPVFGLGDLTVLETDHESALAFLRNYSGSTGSIGDRGEAVLCVFSFLHNPVSFTITAPDLANHTLTDLFGGSRFPSFDADGTVTITLGTQSFYWLRVAQPIAAEVPVVTTAIPIIAPTAPVADDPQH
jgi:maltose alpha-D-glucosyltransferase/alpha-amylase